MSKLRESIEEILVRNPGVRLDSGVDRSALTDELLEAVTACSERQPNPDPSTERTLSELFNACTVYTDRESCETAEISVSGPAVELGAGAFLAFDELPGGTARPVLGYDLPDSGRTYYHPLPADTKVWALDGAVVIGQKDLRLTKQGLGEPKRKPGENPTSPVEVEGGVEPDLDRPWLFTAYAPDEGDGEEEVVDLARFASLEEVYEYMQAELADYYQEKPNKALKMELDLEKHGEVYYRDGRFTLENVEEVERESNPGGCSG